MKVFVGTSGWAYQIWNPELSLDWYIKNSKLNAIELNASFYRFPFPNQVKSWAKKGKDLRWVVKVNRLVTHVYKFGPKSFPTWKKFQKLFVPLEKNIDFYLFQLPPILTPNSVPNIEKFVRKSKLGKRFALEFRNERWFEPKWIAWAKRLGITWVSIDAPILSREVFKISDCVYVRMHGRTGWYFHNYSDSELKEVAKKIKATKPKSAYIFFNNDHNMPSNAQRMLKILSYH